MNESASHPPAPPTAPGVAVSVTQVSTKVGPCRVLIATPGDRHAVDRERLVQMRDGTFRSRLNHELVSGLELMSTSDRPNAVVFRAATPEGRRLGFHTDFSDAEVVEFGLHMVRLQLGLFRRVAALGVHLMVGAEFLPRELEAYDRGAEALSKQLEASLHGGDLAQQQVARVDLWLLDHFALWTGLSDRDYVQARLPADMEVAHRKRKQLEQLLSTLS